MSKNNWYKGTNDQTCYAVINLEDGMAAKINDYINHNFREKFWGLQIGNCRCSKATRKHNFSIYGADSEENKRKIDEVIKLIDEFMNNVN